MTTYKFILIIEADAFDHTPALSRERKIMNIKTNSKVRRTEHLLLCFDRKRLS